jgi:hypothetical protein
MADNENRFAGHEILGTERSTALVIPSCDYAFLDASGADAVPAAGWLGNARYFTVDGDGAIKIDYTNARGETITEVLQVYSGSDIRIRNITKLYRYTSGTTAGTAKSYKSDATLVTNAIKLRK